MFSGAIKTYVANILILSLYLVNIVHFEAVLAVLWPGHVCLRHGRKRSRCILNGTIGKLCALVDGFEMS